jgi:hypothetical protein
MNALGKIAEFIGLRGFIAIGFAVALAVVMWRADAISGQRDKAIQRAANEAAAHSITKASLANLELRLAVFIDEGEQRTKAAQTALRRQQERSAALDAQIARIRAGKPTAANLERCETPQAVTAANGL